MPKSKSNEKGRKKVTVTDLPEKKVDARTDEPGQDVSDEGVKGGFGPIDGVITQKL